MMNSTTPAVVSSQIMGLCARITKKPNPVYVSVATSPDAELNQCFFNVDDHVTRFGGQMICGWTIWEWPNLYIEAEHHAVWRSQSGELVDVSPKAALEQKILFLADKRATFHTSYPKWRDNVRLAVSPDPRVSAFLVASSNFERFIIRHSRPEGRLRKTEVPSHLHGRFDELKNAQMAASLPMREFL